MWRGATGGGHRRHAVIRPAAPTARLALLPPHSADCFALQRTFSRFQRTHSRLSDQVGEAETSLSPDRSSRSALHVISFLKQPSRLSGLGDPQSCYPAGCPMTVCPSPPSGPLSASCAPAAASKLVRRMSLLRGVSGSGARCRAQRPSVALTSSLLSGFLLPLLLCRRGRPGIVISSLFQPRAATGAATAGRYGVCG